MWALRTDAEAGEVEGENMNDDKTLAFRAKRSRTSGSVRLVTSSPGVGEDGREFRARRAGSMLV
jgi:hypothetical protein